MAEYQCIVDNLRNFLASPYQLKTDEIEGWAQEYVRLCREANDRVRQCLNYLKQGLRGEAIHLAEEPPNLVELVAVLDFPELAEWNEACLRHELWAAPPLLREAAALINEAYALEQPFNELIARHRTLALARAPLKDRLALIRRIDAVDGRSVFADDIRSYERLRLDEISQTIRAMAQTNDIHGIRQIQAELNQHRPGDVPLGLQTLVDTLSAACERLIVEDGAVAVSPVRPAARGARLLRAVTCPHCWEQFAPSQVLWVARHSDLHGDSVLGPEKAMRFLATRFTPRGQAIDSRGEACQLVACPHCHLIVPRSIIELAPLFVSVIGGPRSGKSYFLACMTWELRRTMPAWFGLSFSDADTVSNRVLNEYEATLFLADDPRKLAAIRKTELQGDLYDQVNLDGHVMSLPRPFLFDVRPSANHPQGDQRAEYSRMICMYDNAGEHFQPGMDQPGSPVTMHLARSRVLMFLFDPTQDPRFRELCKGLSGDPQLNGARNTQRQETLLIEASLRVRRYANLPPNARHQWPLIVVVSKSDVWGRLLEGEDLVDYPFLPDSLPGNLAGVNTRRIERVSGKLRELLARCAPELVAAAEDFCQHVIYIPVSSLGCSPEEAPLPGASGTGLFVRPQHVKPRWATVPVLYALTKWTNGLVVNNDPPDGSSVAHHAGSLAN